jgi:integrase
MTSAGLGLCRNRHGNQFHTRIHIPKDLAPWIGRVEIRLSLGTEVRRYAIRAAMLIHARKITAFDEVRAVMKDSDATPTLQQQAELRKHLLALIRRRQQDSTLPDEADLGDAQIYAQQADEAHERQQLINAARTMSAEDIGAALMVAYEHLIELQQQRVTIEQTEVARQAAIQVAAKSMNEAYQAHAEGAKARAQARAVVQQAAEREVVQAQEKSAMATQMANLALKVAVVGSKNEIKERPATVPDDTIKFSDLVAEFDAVTSVGKRGRTNAQYLQEAEMFKWVMGDLPISQITGQVMTQFWQVIKQLPPNINKAKRYQGKSPQQIIALGDEPVNIRTAKQRLDRLGSIFAWALTKSTSADQWRCRINRNPVESLVFTRNEKSDLNAKSKRRPFSDDDLHKLFTGIRIEGSGSKAVPYGYGAKRFKKRCQYWLPLMALLTGARGNELAQLRLSDIRRDTDNVYYLHINELPDEDGQRRKSTKNSASQRKVPLHPRLQEWGFLDYVRRLKELGHVFLFPELRPQDVDGREVFGSEMTNWFKRFRESLGVVKNDDGDIVFHSFRHTVTTRLHAAGVSDTDVADILGHEQATEAGRTYLHTDMKYKLSTIVKMRLPDATLNAVPNWCEIEFGENFVNR